MGRLVIQLLRNVVGNRIHNRKKTSFSADESTWTLLNLFIASQPNYGVKVVYGQINTAHADMCFSNIMITDSIF